MRINDAIKTIIVITILCFFAGCGGGNIDTMSSVSQPAPEAAAPENAAANLDPIPANQAPIADAGQDQIVLQNTLATLNGGGSSDPEASPLTYLWAQTSGPDAQLSSTTDAAPSFTPAAAGSYTFSLTVSDGAINSAEDTVTITVSAPVACDTDAGCDDANALTLDACLNPGTAGSSCANTAIACNTSNDCGGANPFCINGGSGAAACIRCSQDSHCDDGNALTNDSCSNGGTAAATCVNTAIPVACNADAGCDDGNALTLDSCANPGTADAACANTAIACNTDNDCGGANPVCVNGGAVAAACVRCNQNNHCDDGDARTEDICSNGGTAAAACSNAAIACLNDGECDDGDTLTNDYCRAAGTASAACFTVSVTNTVDAGYEHACAVTAAGGVKCWGANGNGELGNNDTADSGVPVDVQNVAEAVAVSTGRQFSCALLKTGAAKCWGNDMGGTLGNGDGAGSYTAVDVTGLSNAISISSGGSSSAMHSCAVIADGTIKCWGANSFGQLGDGTTNNRTAPVQVIGIADATAVAAGANHTCAVLSDDTVKCWGYNLKGQLGDNDSPNDKWTPVAVAGLTDVVDIVAGDAHTCAVISNGTMKCWGDNLLGQCGTGVSGNNYSIPTAVFNVMLATRAAAGYRHTCAVMSDHSVKCWGRGNEGELGNSGNASSNMPVMVTGMFTATAIAAGQDISFVSLPTGALQSWGKNSKGQLGDNDAPNNKNQPTNVLGF